MTYLRGSVKWKGLIAEVEAYAFCESCVICKTSKYSNYAPYRLLNTLETNLALLVRPCSPEVGVN
jgi:hypothetical protein